MNGVGLPKSARIGWKGGVALFKRFWPFMRGERKLAWIVLALSVAAIPPSVVSPLLIRRVFDVAIPESSQEVLLECALEIVLLTLFSVALRYSAGIVTIGMQQRVRFRMSRKLFEHVLRLPLRFFHGTETGYVMARMRDDIAALDALMLDTIVEQVVNVLRALVFFAVLVWIDAGLAMAGLILLATVSIGVRSTSKALRERNMTVQELVAQNGTSLHQSLTGIQTVRTTAQERAENRRYSKQLRVAIRAICRRDVMQTSVQYSVGLLMNLGIYVILMYGAWRIIGDRSTVGTLFAFSLYLTNLGTAVTAVLHMNPAVQRALAALQRIYALMDEPIETTSRRAEVELAPTYRVEGRVAFEDVSFTYADGTVALSGISLAVEPGEVLALVGRSGSGKSTLVSLISRLHDPGTGAVRIDGRDVREHPLRLMRREIGVVPQDVFLFNRTVKENIAYATPNATHNEIVAAAKAAHADEFIRRLKDGYDTLVGERGVKLSGGEKQRIAIAREILRDPAILILDEATSSLDSESEALIQDAIERLKKDRTCFVIAHRLSTVHDADRIVVLDRGRAVEIGTHEALLEARGLYHRLHETQFGMEEEPAS